MYRYDHPSDATENFWDFEMLCSLADRVNEINKNVHLCLHILLIHQCCYVEEAWLR